MDPQRSVSASVSARPVVPQLKDFVLTEKLGSGTYATVYKAFKKVLMTTKSIGSSSGVGYVYRHTVPVGVPYSTEQHGS